MSKPEFSKPFNLEHAKAGAPISQADGDAVEILKWNVPGEHPIVGIAKNSTAASRVEQWTASGEPKNMGVARASLVMLPLGIADGKPFYVGDEMVSSLGVPFTIAEWDVGIDGCTWPAPAKAYPVTQMSEADVVNVYMKTNNNHCNAGLIAVANAAIRHAIYAGQVMTAEEAFAQRKEAHEAGAQSAREHEAASREARDMAVAKATQRAVLEAWALSSECEEGRAMESVNLATIIASVKP